MSSSEEVSWINWFCGLRGNEYFCEVDEDYIQDKFNLTGLSDMIPHYKKVCGLVFIIAGLCDYFSGRVRSKMHLKFVKLRSN